MSANVTEEIKKLSIPERLLIVEEIWDSIAQENQSFELTQGQHDELDRRIESLKENPTQGRTWEEIKSEFLNKR
ncbi:MAG: addiction module protein [Ignavibacteriae bacterium]|nr:addiction module protein [Ignavibacteriota bacterium]